MIPQMVQCEGAKSVKRIVKIIKKEAEVEVECVLIVN